MTTADSDNQFLLKLEQLIVKISCGLTSVFILLSSYLLLIISESYVFLFDLVIVKAKSLIVYIR